MSNEFRLYHGSATTEKAVQAAGRVEAIVGAVVNGNRRAWSRIDVEDVALLVQHARDAAASPDWLSKMAINALSARSEAIKNQRDAAIARADAAEAEVRRWREPQGEIDMLISDIEAVIAEAERVDQLGNGPIREAREALATLRARDIGASAALQAAQLRYHEAEATIAALRREGEAP